MGHEHEHHHQHDHGAHGAPAAGLKDPVCGMNVTEASAHRHEHGGETFYFCSGRCREKFAADPIKYLEPAPPAPPAPEGTLYTCPMHPEIEVDHPDSCPKCGMALEPMMPSLDEDESPELVDFRRRFWWTLPLTVVVVVLAMFGEALGLVDMATQSWVELVLAAPVVLWGGWPFFVRGAQSVVNRSPNMWTLIGLGTGAAFVYSVVATVWPEVFPDSFVSMGRVAVYFEAAVAIISLTLLGQLLELGARAQTTTAISPSSASRRRPPAASAPTAARKTSPSPTSTWETRSASDRARRCRSTASSSRARARSTSRCSPASRCPSARPPVTRSSAPP
jgi:Cu+-exporting ATPase